MKERTKKLMSGYDAFKEYDRIHEKYFKGCEYCEGEEMPIASRKEWMSHYIYFQIKGNKLLSFSKKLKNIEWEMADVDLEYDTRYMGYHEINFCPFCGKQLVEKLK